MDIDIKSKKRDPEPPPVRAGSSGQGPKRLFITNLPFSFGNSDLIKLCEPYGDISGPEIIYNERGSKGFGFITFRQTANAEEAKRKLNGLDIGGRIVQVRDATSRPNRPSFQISPSALSGTSLLGPHPFSLYKPSVSAAATLAGSVGIPAFSVRPGLGLGAAAVLQGMYGPMTPIVNALSPAFRFPSPAFGAFSYATCFAAWGASANHQLAPSVGPMPRHGVDQQHGKVRPTRFSPNTQHK